MIVYEELHYINNTRKPSASGGGNLWRSKGNPRAFGNISQIDKNNKNCKNITRVQMNTTRGEERNYNKLRREMVIMCINNYLKYK